MYIHCLLPERKLMENAQPNNASFVRTLRTRASGLVMIGSWVAGSRSAAGDCQLQDRAALCFGFHVRAYARPTLVLAMRQVERERQIRSLREQASGGVECPIRRILAQSGVFVDQPTGLRAGATS